MLCVDRGMARKRRRIVPGLLHELTLSTFQDRYFFIPSDRLNKVIIGAIAYAQEKYGLTICMVSFLSNHGHMLFIPESANQFRDFLCLAKSQIAQEVQRICGWTGGIFEHSDVTVVSDEPEAQVARLEYLMSQGVKEGLVPHPTDWPGIQSAKALMTGSMQLEGVWISRTKLYERVRKHNRRSKAVVRRDLDHKTYKSYEHKMMLELSPIPDWKSLKPKEIAKRSREICSKILRDHADKISTVARDFRKRLMDRDKFCFRPEAREKSVSPIAHAATLEVWQRYKDEWEAWNDKFDRASERLRQGILEAVHEFPEQAFLPTGIWLTQTEGLPPPQRA